MYKVSTIHTMTLDGGIDCLDFVNSGYDIQKDVITERVHSYEDLLILSERLVLFEEAIITGLRKEALANKEAAESAVDRAQRVRAMLYRLFKGVVNHSAEKPDQELLMEINSHFIEAMQFKQLESSDNGMKFSFQADAAGLMAPVWKLVLSAYDLLESDNLQYIKRCQGCSWLFLDKTKNHRKKWCSMQSCGNSQKTKRYYLNRKQQETLD